MMRHKAVLRLSVLFFFLAVVIPVHAQVEEEAESQGGGALGGFLKILGNAAQEVLEEEVQEEIDDWAGTYKGSIGEVVLLERRGNAVTFEVTYKDVKRSDGVYVTGEVLQWGEVQDGFNTTVSPVQEKNGSVKLTIGYQQVDDTGWGLPAEAIDTDQIRLSLVRETNPEKPFGDLVYDFQKTWTDSSDIELLPETEEAAVEDADAIELAEGETTEEGQDAAGASTSKPSVALVKPGTVMLPSKTTTIQNTAVAGNKAAQSAATAASSTASGTTAVPAIGTLSAKTFIPTVSEYNFLENAGKAKWKNASTDLKFPGSTSDKSGFVRTLETGVICPGNNAKNLLETHPQWVEKGHIAGQYPVMIIGENVKFKAVGALLKGADGSDGVIMTVTVVNPKTKIANRIIHKRITTEKYTPLEADLSSLKGQEVQFIFSVNAGQTSTKDWAVWVNPRLTDK